MGATIYDVARLANVSIATVSRTFSAPNSVRPITRERVEKAAHNMGYFPNAIASSMARQSTDKIAFIVCKEAASVLDEFYAGICEGVMHSLNQLDHQLILSTAKEWENSANIKRKQVDGAILAGDASRDMIRTFQQQNVALVLVNNHLEGWGIPSIVSDEQGGIAQALDHLIVRGHRKIAYLAGLHAPYIVSKRHNAFLIESAKRGVMPPQSYMRTCKVTVEDAVKVATSMLTQADPPTAIFATNDMVAVGTMKAALRLGLSIPKDIAVVGFDDSLASRMTEPELTTVRVDKLRMGELCAIQLQKLLAGEEPSDLLLVVPAELCARNST